MRFLADQDIYAVTVRLLRDAGHDIVTASEMGASQHKLLAMIPARDSLEAPVS